jgi:glucokinase
MDSSQIIGVDLGGTQIKFGLFDSQSGILVEQLRTPTLDGQTINGKPAWLETIRAQLEKWSPKRSSPIGLAAPGLASRDGNSIDFMPGRMIGLQGLNWTKALDWQTPIQIINDAHAALLGEIWMGSAKACNYVVLLTLGTGVGGAAFIDGRLIRGTIGRAGHFGHLSLDPFGEKNFTNTPGSLDSALGNATLPERSGGRFDNLKDLTQAASSGDTEAQNVLKISLRNLAAGMTSLINAFDPEIFLLVGGPTNAGDQLLAPLKAELDTIEWRPGDHRVDVRIGSLGNWAGTYGAAYQAHSQD